MKKKSEDKIGLLQQPPLGMPIVPLGGLMGDPLGSYTGFPLGEDGIPAEDMMPVQDADDL